jgi:extracellular elastinolytic metalloproteinase
MRTAALLPLLPFLATLAVARPHSHHALNKADRLRKSLSFGPSHSHASFEIVDSPIEYGLLSLNGEVDAKEVAKAFLSENVGGEEGDSFYIRPDVSLKSTHLIPNPSFPGQNPYYLVATH